ncbi:MAG TPA: peptidoglycan DD-metalloendopeptidase family protein [Vicinamibacterales bacterium]|jgi:murein DD-endopeptidase MepM/ murein hydrolase activator NlpD|nr:peptidoglycan DD-metalloendopeptidase family protein [Vicinamibacterales bacterium]
MSNTPIVNPLVGTTPDVSATGVSGGGKPTAEQIRTLAAQFESMLLSQMLREMRSSMLDEDEDQASGFGDGPLSDAMTSQLGIALAQAGGIGLANAIVSPLTAQAAGESTTTSGLTMPAAFSPAMGASTMPALASALTPGMASAIAPVVAAASNATWAPVASGSMTASGVATAVDSTDGETAGDADADAPPVTLAGRLSSAYGWRRDPIDGTRRFHKGIDVAMPVGQSVPAARDGRVTFAGQMRGYGLTVVIDHGNGLSTRYGHLSAVDVQPGETVTAGETIAQSGSSGRSTGPHLHFEVLDDGQPVNPMVSWAKLKGETGSS